MATLTRDEAMKNPVLRAALLAQEAKDAERGRAGCSREGALPPERKGAIPLPSSPSDRPWSAAKPGTCPMGHRHGSKLEVRACGAVHGELASDERMHVHPRIPCWAMEPDGKGTLYFTPDFVVVGPGPDGRMAIRRVYDAKGRASPEWRRGVAAFRSTYGVEVLEIR